MGQGGWWPGGGPRLPLESPALPLGGARIESPLKTVDFLDAYPDILGRRFEGSGPEDLLDSSGKCPSLSPGVLYLAGSSVLLCRLVLPLMIHSRTSPCVRR